MPNNDSLRGFPVVLLCGPPGCGKDTAGEILRKAHAPYVPVLKFAGALKAATHALFGRPELPIDAFEGPAKEQPNEIFFAVKPVFGDQFFGRVMVATLAYVSAQGASMAVITDSGFPGEAQPTAEAVGADDVLLIHLHRDGCTYAGDSRSYWELPNLKPVIVTNNGTIGDLQTALLKTVNDWWYARWKFHRNAAKAEAA
jgi:hypothetical protein